MWMKTNLDPRHVDLATAMWRKKRSTFDSDDLVVSLWLTTKQAAIHRRIELVESLTRTAPPDDIFRRGLLAILNAGPTTPGTFRVVVMQSDGEHGTLSTGEVQIPKDAPRSAFS